MHFLHLRVHILTAQIVFLFCFVCCTLQHIGYEVFGIETSVSELKKNEVKQPQPQPHCSIEITWFNGLFCSRVCWLMSSWLMQIQCIFLLLYSRRHSVDSADSFSCLSNMYLPIYNFISIFAGAFKKTPQNHIREGGRGCICKSLFILHLKTGNF